MDSERLGKKQLRIFLDPNGPSMHEPHLLHVMQVPHTVNSLSCKYYIYVYNQCGDHSVGLPFTLNSLSSLEVKRQMGKFKKLCVFCGSNSGNRKIFSDAALDLGRELVERKIDLIYGGGSIGLMGLVSQTVFDGGCNVLGVIPTPLVPVEISGHAVGEVLIVYDMHERKSEMARRADAFIALPGGYGTMEELLEMISWSQLGVHDKPVGLLNVDGYYDCLLGLFDKGVDEGFIKPSARNIVVSAKTAPELIERMEEYVPLHDQVAPSNSWNMEEPEIIDS